MDMASDDDTHELVFRRKNGLISDSSVGTLHLENVVAAPPERQAQLYAAMRNTATPVYTGPRLIVSTARDEEVNDPQKMRSELRDHLLSAHVLRMDIPSLAERHDDIPDLFRHYLRSAPNRSGFKGSTDATKDISALASELKQGTQFLSDQALQSMAWTAALKSGPAQAIALEHLPLKESIILPTSADDPRLVQEFADAQEELKRLREEQTLKHIHEALERIRVEPSDPGLQGAVERLIGAFQGLINRIVGAAILRECKVDSVGKLQKGKRKSTDAIDIYLVKEGIPSEVVKLLSPDWYRTRSMGKQSITWLWEDYFGGLLLLKDWLEPKVDTSTVKRGDRRAPCAARFNDFLTYYATGTHIEGGTQLPRQSGKTRAKEKTGGESSVVFESRSRKRAPKQKRG
jgi:hypothetical protein